jgi:hypothetical protein
MQVEPVEPGTTQESGFRDTGRERLEFDSRRDDWDRRGTFVQCPRAQRETSTDISDRALQKITENIAGQVASKLPGTTVSIGVTFFHRTSKIKDITARVAGSVIARGAGERTATATYGDQCSGETIPDRVQIEAQGRTFEVHVDKPNAPEHGPNEQGSGRPDVERPGPGAIGSSSKETGSSGSGYGHMEPIKE